jgi:predicted transcriptional regulator
MTKNTIIDTLKDLGLKEQEADFYYSALSLGPNTIGKIAGNAGILRTTAYSIYESLKKKGLMNIELRGFKKLYVAENPEKLENILERRKELFRKKKDEFMALYNLKGGESFIKYYEGLEGIKSVYEGLLKDAEPFNDYLILTNTELWNSLDPVYFEDFKQRRAKMNFNMRALFQDSDYAQKEKRERGVHGMDVRTLPAGTTLSTNLVVIPKRVIIHQLHPPVFAIAIENKSIVQMHREMFEIIWNTTPE